MKRIDHFCTSPASTPICVSSIDQAPMVRHCGGRAIDRHNPHLRDVRRSKGTPPAAAAANHSMNLTSSESKLPKKHTKPYNHNHNHKTKPRSPSAKTINDLNISPPASSRYLLSDTSFFDVLTDFEQLPCSVAPNQSARFSSHKPADDYPSFPPISSSSSSCTATTTCNDHQMVALRVSLHCRGCEGKVRKHLSKMKGVTSFDIDFAMKKVTVTGDVTPLGVLASISKVKNAQFWPSLSSSSALRSTY